MRDCLRRFLRAPVPRSLVVAAMAWAVLVVTAASAQAQGASAPSPRDLAEAQSLFLAGTQAVQAGRWADAVGSFRRAYRLSHAPSALYNLAVSLRALGRDVEARDTFAALLARHRDTMEPGMRAQAERFHREEVARVAVLRLLGLPHQVRFAFHVDDRDVADDGSRPASIDLDAGHHRVVAEGEGFEPFSWEGSLSQGDRHDVRVQLRRPSGSIFASPIFWVVVGAVVAVGGTALVLYLARHRPLVPQGPAVVAP